MNVNLNKLLKMVPSKLMNKIILYLERENIGESKLVRDFYREKYKVDVDMYSYGGCFSPTFNNGGKVSIGKYCSIAENVRYFAANHPIEKVTTSAYFYNSNFSKLPVKDVERGTLKIGNDVWIGYGVIITNKCKNIGDGAVIGAGSIVTKDIPDYAIVAGNPARVIRYRFAEKNIELIKSTAWWNYTPQELIKVYDVMDNLEKFTDEIQKISNNEML